MMPERRLRLCILAPVMRRHRGYFTPHSGLVAKVLADLGHEVVVLSADLPEGGGAVEQENGYEVRYLAGTPAEKKGGPFWKNSAVEFDSLHAERPFDIVFGRGLATWGFFRYSRHSGTVPVILHEGTYPRWLHQIETRLGRLAPLLSYPLAPIFALKNHRLRHCLKFAARVVCNNPALADAHRRISWWNPPHALSLIYGVDTSRYHPRPATTDQQRLVTLGRLAKDKGVLVVIEVLARLKHPLAVLEAMGPASTKMHKAVLDRARRLGVADRYSAPGPVEHEDVPDRLAGAAAFLFPSTHAEGLPKAVLEAMACGLPVVAYRQRVLEGVIVDGVTGFVVPIRSVAVMTRRVDQLLSDPALMARMGIAARRKIETDFAPQAINAKWQALLTEVVAEVSARQGG